MAGPRDPVRVLLRSVLVVGEECCWPATEIVDVVHAFEKLERVILGAELWRFEDAPEPIVLGWTEYEVPEGSWPVRVAVSNRLALDELTGHAGDLTAWVNLTWDSQEDASD